MKKVKMFTMLLSVMLITNSFTQTATMNDVLTKKVKGNLESIQLDNGAILKIGDTLIIGMSTGNNGYRFVVQNLSCALAKPSPGIQCVDNYHPLGAGAGGSRVVIKTLRAITKKVVVVGTHAQGVVYGTRILSISSAIESSEIRINGFMTSDEALVELKKAKDKLDLGLITQEEFDAIKDKLSKSIN